MNFWKILKGVGVVLAGISLLITVFVTHNYGVTLLDIILIIFLSTREV